MALAYFITWTTYGTWLPGDQRCWVLHGKGLQLPDLIRELEELSGGVYAPSPGVVYPTLTMLAEMGLTEEAAQEGSRKQFAITATGSAHLAENYDAVELLFERIKRMGSDGTTADHTPIMRALDNLHAVLRHRLSRDGAGVTTILDAAALIDEAAQKIERL